MSSKPAPSADILRSQEAAFIEHYSWLIRWALQLTNNDRARAEDLVQEVFTQLAFRHTNLSSVNNIPGYLYSALRNIHASEMRLAGRSHIQSPTIVEYNLAATALSACNPYDLYQTQDHLRRICYYACVRKESSRAGSVMILRFFLGYHLSEVALVLGVSYQAVRQCLRFARNEARAFLDDPDALAFITGVQTLKRISPNGVRGAEELMADLRLAIFRSNQGECLSSDLFRAFYQKDLIATANNATLAHVVSCRCCLDTVNRLLNLPLLAERHAADALGPDNRSRRGPGAPGSSGGGRNGRFGNQDRKEEITSAFLLRCQRRARELFEHHPRELCVSVNGHLLGSQSVNSETSRLRLDITIPEPLSFIEILSEEKARLLMMAVDEPPNSEPTQTKCVTLSEGRYIEVTLHYGHPWPMLEVVYHDPNFTAESLISISGADKVCGLSAAQDLSTVPREVEFDSSLDGSHSGHLTSKGSLALLAPQSSLPTRLIKTVSRRTRYSLVAVWLWLMAQLNLTRQRYLTLRALSVSAAKNPGLITAVVAIFLIGTLLYLRLGFVPTASAASLIARASAAEQTLKGIKDRAVHRVINLEERAHAGGNLIARSRIEIWREPGTDRSVRRVYDDQGQLIAGEWASSDPKEERARSRRIYRRGAAPNVESSLSNPQAAIRDSEFWQLEPSAGDYAEIVPRTDSARVDEDSTFYIISYVAHRPTSSDTTLWGATLTLRKSDLHPVAQTLSVQRNGQIREIRLVEASFEQRTLDAVSPAVFDVDPELVSEGTKVGGKVKAESNALKPSALNHNVAVVATPELEIEVAYALDQSRSILGDQVNLSRTPEGLLRVDGVVDTDQRKQEVLRALSRVMNHPAVKIEIRTVTEELARQSGRTPDSAITREFSGSDNAIPVYGELYRYYSQAPAGKDIADGRIEQQVRSLAVRVVGRSRRVLSHAIELKQLKERFSVSQLKVLTPNSRAQLFGMLSRHAESLRREASLLEQELAPIFFSKTPDAEIGAIEISTATELYTAIERLYQVALANDEKIRSAFTASAEAAPTTLVKGQRFQVSLVTAGKLAGKIRAAAISLQSQHNDE